jgi:threonine aldolase
MIDLRSDTVTRPTEAMRKAMASAEVGDDVFREDPTVRRLEERAGELLGKEVALFVPSGSMANQLALLLHCRASDEVICGEGAHLFYYEGGAGPALSGVQFVEARSGGLFTRADAEAVAKPRAYYLPRTRLVAIENTHNRAGGRVFPQSDVEDIAAWARRSGLAVHLDGARIWNASVATGRPEADLARPADTVSACFSKGLGAPVGSVLALPRDRLDDALHFRRVLGGAMRQAGILCAAALHALEHHRARIAEDHENARLLARALADSSAITCAPAETNIVNFDLTQDAEVVALRARDAGVLVGAIGPHRIRAVTHLGVSRGDVSKAADVLRSLAEAPSSDRGDRAG